MRLRSDRLKQHNAYLIPIVLAAVAILSGCGNGGNAANPSPTSEPTEGPIPTLTADQISVGDLLKRIDTAWPTVTNMREVAWSGSASSTVGTPPADVLASTEETVLPASRRITTTMGGAPTDDQISVNGAAYFKGSFVVGAVAPFAGADTWVQVDPAIVPADSMVGQRLAYLTRPIAPPYGTVSNDLRARAATPAGTIEAGGRTCSIFTFVDTTTNGSKIDYALSLDDKNLPCSLVQSAGGFENITIYTFNDPKVVISVPEGATPVSATPEG